MKTKKELDRAHKEVLARLRDCKEDGDYEAAHIKADECLCTMLSMLGYDDVVKAWDEVGKWYA